jgi:restriction endonuclease
LPYLPGDGRVGVGNNWLGGSKTPAIIALLSQTLELDRSRFEPLIVEIVRQGIVYRKKKGTPLTPDDIDLVNGHTLDLGFKFPELWDPDFKASLRQGSAQRSKDRIDEAMQEERVKETARDQRQVKLEALKQDFLSLHTMTDRPKAGLALERLLTELFSLFGLSPRQSFRVVGEQIDGSFELDHHSYLLEAKWEHEPLSEAPLSTFREKVVGKSSISRGVFISVNGFSQPAKDAISRGKQPLFFAMDGHDLMMILSGQIVLDEFLRQRRRLLADEGFMFVPFGELFKGSRNV